MCSSAVSQSVMCGRARLPSRDEGSIACFFSKQGEECKRMSGTCSASDRNSRHDMASESSPAGGSPWLALRYQTQASSPFPDAEDSASRLHSHRASSQRPNALDHAKNHGEVEISNLGVMKMAAANHARASRSGEARHYAIESRAKAAPTVFVCTVKRTLQLTAPAFQLTAMFRSCVAGPLLEVRAESSDRGLVRCAESLSGFFFSLLLH
jgi:hypothetical protein